MIRLPQSLRAWPSTEFGTVLKDEIERLDADLLPLQQGLAHASYVSESKPTAIFIGAVEEPATLRVTVGILYAGIVVGCSCADDPTPIDETSEYCELRFDIDRKTAEATVVLLLG